MSSGDDDDVSAFSKRKLNNSLKKVTVKKRRKFTESATAVEVNNDNQFPESRSPSPALPSRLDRIPSPSYQNDSELSRIDDDLHCRLKPKDTEKNYRRKSNTDEENIQIEKSTEQTSQHSQSIEKKQRLSTSDRKRSRSRSTERRRKSHSRSPDRRKISRSISPRRSKRSKNPRKRSYSRSPIRKRSCSRSPIRKRSRSRSPVRKRLRSRSPIRKRSRSRSPVRNRRSRSRSRHRRRDRDRCRRSRSRSMDIRSRDRRRSSEGPPARFCSKWARKSEGLTRAVLPAKAKASKPHVVSTEEVEERLARHMKTVQQRAAEEAKRINLPGYLNPAMINVHQFKQVQDKRKLLWSKTKDKKEGATQWAGAFDDQNSDEKFKRLMGIQGIEVSAESSTVKESRKVLDDLEREYEKSRAFQMSRGSGGITGIGLGFGSIMPSEPQ